MPEKPQHCIGKKYLTIQFLKIEIAKKYPKLVELVRDFLYL